MLTLLIRDHTLSSNVCTTVLRNTGAEDIDSKCHRWDPSHSVLSRCPLALAESLPRVEWGTDAMPSSRSFSRYGSLLHQLSELDMLFSGTNFFSGEFLFSFDKNVTWSSAIPCKAQTRLGPRWLMALACSWTSASQVCAPSRLCTQDTLRCT